MRSLLVCLLFAASAPGQTTQPNAVRLTKYILGVADLDRSYAFYHALVLDTANHAPLAKPAVLPDMLLKLVNVPPGTKFRNMMIKIPNAPFDLEVTEFSGLGLHPVRPSIQEPGASLLHLTVDDLDAAVSTAQKAGAEVVTTAGFEVAGEESAARAVRVKDPDGYYVELIQAHGVAAGTGKVIGASFSSMMVADSEKASAFYRDWLGFAVYVTNWSTPGAQTRKATMTIPGTSQSWTLIETKGVKRAAPAPRIPDPGAAAVGLQVRDIDAAVKAVKAAGGSSITQGGSIKLGTARVGFVRDPSGILVELTQP